MDDFNNLSYKLHSEFIEQRESSNDYTIETVFDKSLPKYYAHELMMRNLNPLLAEGKNWLTLGDMWGRDASYIIENKSKCMATDLSDAWLSLAKDKGYIDSFQIENAEKLSFDNDHFDYVVLKDAYHHCPRPYLAIYEMLRVAKEAIVIVECIDLSLKMPLMLAVYNTLDKINTGLASKFHKNRYSFESVGNFVYKISERELEKVALGINLPMVAFKPFHKVVPKKLQDKDHSLSGVKFKRQLLNMGSKLGIFPYSHLSAVIFKKQPSEALMSRMKEFGYRFSTFTKNPYL